jgi:peptidoglycan hydrolase-like protein with peptidoglycan-binding domain
VAALQRWLNAHDWDPDLPDVEVDGTYGPETTAAVRAAQAQLGVTGVHAVGTPVGPRTNLAFWRAGFRG